jgi:hypothetical protein
MKCRILPPGGRGSRRLWRATSMFDKFSGHSTASKSGARRLVRYEQRCHRQTKAKVIVGADR